MDMKKAVKLFGLSSVTSAKEVKEIFRTVAKNSHPDMLNGSERKMREINLAYKVLIEYIERYPIKVDEATVEKLDPEYPVKRFYKK